jgi:hypothetical protein
MNILANLPRGFFSSPALASCWSELESFAHLRRSSCNTLDEMEPHLDGVDAVLMWSWPRWTPEVL